MRIKSLENLAGMQQSLAIMSRTNAKLIDDEGDRRLMAALRGNARMSVTELAHTLGMSRTTVRQRMDALRASGRIRRYTIETNTTDENQIKAIRAGRLSRSRARA